MMNSNEMLILFSLYVTLLLEKISKKKNPNSFRQLKNEQCQSPPSDRFVTDDNHFFLS